MTQGNITYCRTAEVLYNFLSTQYFITSQLQQKNHRQYRILHMNSSNQKQLYIKNIKYHRTASELYTCNVQPEQQELTQVYSWNSGLRAK